MFLSVLLKADKKEKGKKEEGEEKVMDDSVQETIVRTMLPTALRRSRALKKAPCVKLREMQCEHFGPAQLTTKRRRSLLTKILNNEEICLESQKPFVNFETDYIKELFLEKATDVILCWQSLEINGCFDNRDTIVVGFALITSMPDSFKLSAICSCRAMCVTSKLFDKIFELGKRNKAQSLQVGSLPHVCYYYYSKQGFRFNDIVLNDLMREFAQWVNGLEQSDKHRLIQYLSNLATDNLKVKNKCLQGLLSIRNRRDPLFQGKQMMVSFLRAAGSALGLGKKCSYDALLNALSKNGVQMHLVLVT